MALVSVHAILQRGHLSFWNEPVYVFVTGLSGAGWFASRFTLRQYVRARAALARVEVLHINVVGDLTA